MKLEHVQLFEDFVNDLQNEDSLNEAHLEDRKDQEAFIIKNSDKTADDLKELKDEEVEKLYKDLEVKESEEEKKKEEDDDDDDDEDENLSDEEKMTKVRAVKKD